MKKILTGALLLGAAIFAQVAAHAGELSLYTHSNFNGREVTLRGATPDLSELGFNDRASSMRVRSGRWEVCVDAGFSGGCTVVEPGEYPTMERFNDQISSVREVDGRDGGRRHGGRERHGRRGMLELFSSPDLRGNSTRVVRDTNDFSEIGFNDRAFSLQVEDGTWQLCSDADYGGVCRVFEPGRYRDVGRELNGRVSSARLIDGGGGGRDRRDERPRDDGRGRGDEAPVVLFAEGDMRGRPVPLLGDARNFGEADFNDKAGSIVVNEGQWEFCEHAEFRGRCVVYGPGRYPRLDGMNNRISSARRVR